MQAVSLLLNWCFRARIVPLSEMSCWGQRMGRQTDIHMHMHSHTHSSGSLHKSSPIHFRTYEMYRNTFLCSEITDHIVLSERTEMSVFLSNKQGFVVKGLLFLLSMGYWSVSDSRPCPENTWQMLLSGFSVDPQTYYWPLLLNPLI